jgi:predicted O-methyltransferase YrrM
MEPIDGQLVERIDTCIERLFVPEDPALLQNLKDAEAAGLPAISVSPNQGKLLYMIARIAGAKRALEIGTLGGYSTTWLARALPNSGKLVTLEVNAKFAQVARKNLQRCGLKGIVEIQVGNAAERLQRMIDRHEETFDLIFIDADKPSYVNYLNLGLQVSRPGTIILADNVIRNGRAFDDQPEDANARGAKAFNLAIASDPRLDSIILPIYRGKIDGLSISIVKSAG